MDVRTNRDIEELLLKAGYSRHPKGNGFIKPIGSKKRCRYHVLLRRKGCHIHIDRTRGWKHVPGKSYPLKGELRRIGFTDEEMVEEK